MATFTTIPEATFLGSITIICKGREQKLEGTMVHMSHDEYKALFAGLADGSIKSAAAVLQIFKEWNADRPLTLEGVSAIMQDMPGIDWAIVTGYGEALTATRKGN